MSQHHGFYLEQIPVASNYLNIYINLIIILQDIQISLGLSDNIHRSVTVEHGPNTELYAATYSNGNPFTCKLVLFFFFFFPLAMVSFPPDRIHHFLHCITITNFTHVYQSFVLFYLGCLLFFKLCFFYLFLFVLFAVIHVRKSVQINRKKSPQASWHWLPCYLAYYFYLFIFFVV